MHSTPAPQFDVPPLVANQPNRWCVEGQYKVYRDAKFLNDKGFMTYTLTAEQRVLTRSLHTVPAIHDLFTRHQLKWMSGSVGRYIGVRA